jgi:heme/copper-type cytochrome/quinol oxidase subunit 2
MKDFLMNYISTISLLIFLFSLAISVRYIFKKHKHSENFRVKIAKDILILVITLLLIIFLGGLAGLFANQYASPRFGAVVGFVSAIAASLAVGYLVKMGAKKISS